MSFIDGQRTLYGTYRFGGSWIGWCPLVVHWVVCVVFMAALTMIVHSGISDQHHDHGTEAKLPPPDFIYRTGYNPTQGINKPHPPRNNQEGKHRH